MISIIKRSILILCVLYIVGLISMFGFGLNSSLSVAEIILYPLGLGLLELILEPIFGKIYKSKLFRWIDSLSFIPKILLILVLLLIATVVLFIVLGKIL